MVVDRLLVKPGIEKRLEASIETATKLANGLVLIAVVNGEERLYSQKLACTECGTSVPQLEPRSFSFNSPYGACEECHGLGSKWSFDPGKVIVDPAKPLLEGGLGPGGGSGRCSNRSRKRRRQSRINLKKPSKNCRKKSRDAADGGACFGDSRNLIRYETVVGRVSRVAHGLHVAGGVPGVPGQAVAARQSGGARQELFDRGVHSAADLARPGDGAQLGIQRARDADRGAGAG